MKEDPKSVRDTNVIINKNNTKSARDKKRNNQLTENPKSARDKKRNNQMKDNPKSARDTNVIIN